MKLKKTGENISAIDVLNISKHGFGLLVHGREYFLNFGLFSWFREAKAFSILKVQLPLSHHLYWPNLDVDLELDSIEFPEKYPLMDMHKLVSEHIEIVLNDD